MAYRAMTFRINCPMRHENGNCLVCGGFCTSVSDPICEALHRAYECGYQKGLYGVSGIDIALKGIKILNEGPAADVVEVVRCKDCQYWEKATVNGKGFLICPASGMDITSDDFCSYGERKEGAE